MNPCTKGIKTTFTKLFSGGILGELVFVKLGGSLITLKSAQFTSQPGVIARLAEELKRASDEGISLLIGHGGGSFPHVSAEKYKTAEGMIGEKSARGFCEVQNDASKLNRIIVQAMLDAGLNAVSVQPSASAIASNGKIVDWNTQVMEKLLSLGITPMPFGDVALDLEKGCCIISTEEQLAFLCEKLKPARLVAAGKVDGVLDGENKVIERITAQNFEEVKSLLKGSDATDVTGGMLHKVEVLVELAGKGVKSRIINGMAPDRLRKAVLGEEVLGTVVG